MDAWHIQIPTTITCTRCANKTIDPNDIQYEQNNIRNSVTRIMLKGICESAHATHICPICITSSRDIKTVKRCFDLHMRGRQQICPPWCKKHCSDFDSWMNNHHDEDPNFSISGKAKRKTPHQQRQTLSNAIEYGQYIDLSNEITTLRDSSTTECDILWNQQPSDSNTPTQDEWPSYDNIQRSLVSCISHSLICQDTCLDLHLPSPLKRQPDHSHHPFQSKQHLHFCINHYINSNITDNNTNKLLYDIHNTYTTTPINLPQSVYEIKRDLSNIPKIQSFTLNDHPKSPLFNIGDIISNIMADKNLSSHLKFDFHDHMSFVSEVYNSSDWNRVMQEEKERAPDTLPILLLLYYDDFRKFKLAPGSCGGFYLSILNMDRSMLSQPMNLFCVGLVNSEEDYWSVVDNVVSQLEELYKPHYVRMEKRGLVKVSVRLVMHLADTPQRSESCQTKGHNGYVFCHQCMTNKKTDITIHKEARTVPLMRKHLEELKGAKSKQEEEDIKKKYGLNPSTTPNPFFRLYDLYKFDIYQDSPVDFFHVGLIGLLPTTISLINDLLPERTTARISEVMSKYWTSGESLQWKHHGYWTGEHWLKFFSICCFVYQELLDGNDNTHAAILVCLFRLCEWLRVLHQRHLSKRMIEEAEANWRIWINHMIHIFGEEVIKSKPNFHNSGHVFSFARRWGPPILYWSRPFEHRHKVFKQFITESNHKDVLIWCANRDSLLQSLRFTYPHLELFISKNISTCKPMTDDIILYFESGIRYGLVKRIGTDTMEITPLTFTSVHRFHKCPDWASRVTVEPVSIHKDMYMGHASLIESESKHFVNHFSLLNLVKR